jgi:hypothetical protein
MGDWEDGNQRTENRRQTGKDCRGAVCDPPAVHYESVDSSPAFYLEI